MKGSASVSASTFTQHFASWAWAKRVSMPRSEASGLYATLIIPLNACLENFVVELIRFKLKYRDIGLYHLDNKATPYDISGRAINIRMEPEKDLIARLKQNIENKLTKASYSSLNELMQHVLGTKISTQIGREQNEAWSSLASFRNMIARGRRLEYKLDGLKPDLNFDETQLKTAMNYLSGKKVIEVKTTSMTGPIDALLSEQVVRHYYNITSNI